MTLLFFPFSPQWNIVQLYQEELVIVLLLAGNFPVHTATVAPVQNNLMVFMRRSCKRKLKPLHATSINALLLFLSSNLQGTLVMDHSLYSGWSFGRKGSSMQQVELISEWGPWLYICCWGTSLTEPVEIAEAESITYDAQESGYYFLPPLQWREKQTIVKLKATNLQADPMQQIHIFSVWMWCLLSQSVTEVKLWQDTKGDTEVTHDKTLVVIVRIKNTQSSQNRRRSTGFKITVNF